MTPTAGATSATVNQNSSGNPLPLNITGGIATSVAVASGPSNGTATVSGASIIYTPTASYSGSDTLTYTATNAGGTSSAATVTITVVSSVHVSPTPVWADFGATSAFPGTISGFSSSQYFLRNYASNFPGNCKPVQLNPSA